MISIRHHLSNSFYDPDTVLNEKAQAVWRYLNKENVVGAGAVRVNPSPSGPRNS
jgi:hypothetical protein